MKNLDLQDIELRYLKDLLKSKIAFYKHQIETNDSYLESKYRRKRDLEKRIKEGKKGFIIYNDEKLKNVIKKIDEISKIENESYFKLRHSQKILGLIIDLLDENQFSNSRDDNKWYLK